MKLKLAFDYFNDAIKESDEIIEECNEDLKEMLIEQKEHFIIALKALEKQISKKPTHVTAEKDTQIGSLTFHKGTKIYSCKCGKWIGYRDLFCRYCGQKLDWD